MICQLTLSLWKVERLQNPLMMAMVMAVENLKDLEEPLKENSL